MGVFAVIAGARWLNTANLFFALLFIRDCLLCVLFMRRIQEKRRASVGASILAYGSTVLPLCYSAGNAVTPVWMVLTSDLLFILGFGLATLATIELGSSMGVAPALRGPRRKCGVYKFIRHPMYTGYIVAEVGWLLLSANNVPLFAISTTCYLLRIVAEERVLRDSSTSA